MIKRFARAYRRRDEILLPLVSLAFSWRLNRLHVMKSAGDFFLKDGRL